MKQRRRICYTETDRALILDRWIFNSSLDLSLLLGNTRDLPCTQYARIQ